MLLFIFYCFLAYLAYQLIFNFIIPIYRTTKKVKQGFREMQQKMQHQQHQQQQQQAHGTAPSRKQPTGKVGEYIDFEEVKE